MSTLNAEKSKLWLGSEEVSYLVSMSQNYHITNIFNSLNDTQHESGLNLGDFARPQWHIYTVLDRYTSETPHPSDFELPHLGCLLVNEPITIKNGELLRSEMLCVTALMAGRLSSSEYAMHRNVPVWFLSI